MKYPQEFVDAVKDALPGRTILHQALDEGSESVGSTLKDEGFRSLGADHVIQMISGGCTANLLAEAKHVMHIRWLFYKWEDIMRK